MTLHRVNEWVLTTYLVRGIQECANDLVDFFKDIFNTLLSFVVVPACLKATKMILVPKKSTVSFLDDYQPVALMPIVMKCFKRLVLRRMKNKTATES